MIQFQVKLLYLFALRILSQYYICLKFTTVKIVIIALRKRKEDENELNMKVI